MKQSPGSINLQDQLNAKKLKQDGYYKVVHLDHYDENDHKQKQVHRLSINKGHYIIPDGNYTHGIIHGISSILGIRIKAAVDLLDTDNFTYCNALAFLVDFQRSEIFF